MTDFFRIPVRVYYEDTDAEGLVYYANYLKYAERARTEFLRSCNLSLETSKNGDRCGFVARHVDIEYKASAFLDDLLSVSCQITELKNSSVTVFQEIKRGDDLLCVIKIILVYININRHRPTKITDEMRAKIIKIEA